MCVLVDEGIEDEIGDTVIFAVGLGMDTAVVEHCKNFFGDVKRGVISQEAKGDAESGLKRTNGTDDVECSFDLFMVAEAEMDEFIATGDESLFVLFKSLLLFFLLFSFFGGVLVVFVPGINEKFECVDEFGGERVVCVEAVETFCVHKFGNFFFDQGRHPGANISG